MILTVTLNPCVHKFVLAMGTNRGPVVRPVKSSFQVGGKGINVARAIHRLGGRVKSLSTRGGHIGALMSDSVRDEGFEASWVDVESPTRMSTFLMRADGVREYLEEGGPVQTAERESFWEALRVASREAEGIVLSGSSPDEPFHDLFADFLNTSEPSPPVFVDTYGPPAARIYQRLREGRGPYLFKANRDEIAQSFGVDVESHEALRSWAEEFLEAGTRAVVISHSKKGAVLYSREQVLIADPPQINELNPVGSGDAMLGAMVLALVGGDSLERAFAVGVASGAQNAASLEVCSVDRETVERLASDVRIRRLGNEVPFG